MFEHKWLRKFDLRGRVWTKRIGLATGLAALGYVPFSGLGRLQLERAVSLEQQVRHLHEKNIELQQDNDAMLREIHGLRDNSKVIERVARDELGLVKSEDIVFKFE